MEFDVPDVRALLADIRGRDAEIAVESWSPSSGVSLMEWLRGA
ncbi:hypothetical protein [Raineyella fluvialis]|nr:hypothetical protein [Raineyella fluvialis]